MKLDDNKLFKAAGGSQSTIILVVRKVIEDFDISLSDEQILLLYSQEGCTLRNAIKQLLPEEYRSRANIIPCK